MAKTAPRYTCLLGNMLEVFGSNAISSKKKYSVPLVRKNVGNSWNTAVVQSINTIKKESINFTFFVLYATYHPKIRLAKKQKSIPAYLLLAHCHQNAGYSTIHILASPNTAIEPKTIGLKRWSLCFFKSDFHTIPNTTISIWDI